MQMSAWVRKPQDGRAATLTQLIRPACQWKKLLWSFYVQTHSCQEASGRKIFRGCQMIRAYFEVQKCSPLSYLQPLTSAISSTWTDVSPFRILQSYMFLKAGPKFNFIEEIFLIPQPGQTCPSSGHYRFALMPLAMLCTEVTTLDVH